MGDERLTICRKCLIRDMPEAEFFENMYDYIANIPEEDKVSDAEYERRLNQCRRCGDLLNGMCRICGCFVEMRAAVALRHCPGQSKRW